MSAPPTPSSAAAAGPHPPSGPPSAKSKRLNVSGAAAAENSQQQPPSIRPVSARPASAGDESEKAAIIAGTGRAKSAREATKPTTSTASTTSTAAGGGGGSAATANRPKTPAGSGIHAVVAISKKSLLSKTYTAKYILGSEKKESGSGTEVFCVRYSPNGKYVAASSGDSSIKVYNSQSGISEYNLSSQSETAMPTTCVRWRPAKSNPNNNNLIAADASGNISHWQLGSKTPLHTIHQPDNQVFALDYMEDGSCFATAGYDRVVRIYDEETKAETRVLGGGFVFGGRFKTGHSNRVFSLKFSTADPNILLSGGWDNTIQIWDLRNVHPVRSIFGPHVCGDSVDLRGNTVLSGSWRLETPIQLWDLPSGKLIRNIPFSISDNTCCVYAAQFSKDSNYSRVCAGGSGTHEARLFDTHTGDIVGRITGMTQGVYSVDFHPTLQQLVVGSGDGTVRIVEFPS